MKDNDGWGSKADIYSKEGGGFHFCYGSCTNDYYTGNYHDYIPFGYADLSTERANIEASVSGIGGVDTSKEGKETRPINMAVVWIIRIL